MDEYFLHVDMMLAPDKADTFDKLMGQFLTSGGFGQLFSGHLLLALKSEGPVPYPGYALTTVPLDVATIAPPAEPKAIRYVHLWSVPAVEDLDLARAMTQSGDNLLYLQIHGMVLAEAQNLVVYVDPAAGKARLPELDKDHREKFTEDTRFVRKTRHFTPVNLQAYLHGLNALAPLVRSSTKTAAWRYVGDFQGVTGELNTVVEFWINNHGAAGAATCDDPLLNLGSKLSELPHLKQSSLATPYRTEKALARGPEIFLCPPYFS
jgi:hypothetical protein